MNESVSAHSSAAKEYMKRNPSAKWCPICATIYLFRFAPVLTTLSFTVAGFIGWLIARLLP